MRSASVILNEGEMSMNRASCLAVGAAWVGGVLLCAALCAGNPARAWADAASHNAFIHFFVIPAQGEVDEAAVEALTQDLVAMAGGYTELGQASGGDRGPEGAPQGTVSRSNHRAFLVAAREDLSVRLEALLTEKFQDKTPFVLVWKGNCSLFRQ